MNNFMAIIHIDLFSCIFECSTPDVTSNLFETEGNVKFLLPTDLHTRIFS